MFIQLKDHTGKVHRVPAEGAIFGRDRTRCDVVLPDIGVSGVHAKIYCRQGRWFLEDLHSSNGTFVGEQRVTGPVELARGAAFGLFRWRFEVTDISATAAAAEPDASPHADDSKTAALKVTAPPEDEPSDGGSAVAPVPVPVSASAPAAHVTANQPAVKTTTHVLASADVEGQQDEAANNTTADGVSWNFKTALSQFRPARLLSGIKAALAYYPVAIPKLALRPFTFVRASIAEPKYSAMVAADLAAWAFPSMLLGGFVSVIAALVISAVAGHIYVVNQVVIAPITAIVIAAVSSVITGLLWHPLLHWLVRKLGGRSNAVLRTNMFVALYTAVPLGSIAAAVGTLVMLAPVPFMGLVAPLLSIVATFILLLVAFLWYQHFAVARWFLILIVVLGAVSMYGYARSLIATSQVSIAQFRQRGVAATVVSTSVGGREASHAEAVTTVKPISTDSARPVGVTPATASAVTPTAAPSSGTIVSAATGTAPAATGTTPPATATPVGPVTVVSSSSTAVAGTRLTYPQFVAQRDAVEKAIETDPTVLTHSTSVLDLYRKLHSESDRVGAKYTGKGKKDPDDVVMLRLRDAELYEATAGIVGELDRLIRVQNR